MVDEPTHTDEQDEQDELLERKKLETYLIRKAWADQDFKQRLIDKPQSTIEAELKALDPEATLGERSISVKVVAEMPDEVCMVIPLNPADYQLEVLSDDQLEQVAGGGCSCKNQGCNKCAIRLKCKLDVDVPIIGTKIAGSPIDKLR
tara:strand:- start:2867 stop:3307 length:441 start_codon:yes stop_codon:yes gene_type:complete